MLIGIYNLIAAAKGIIQKRRTEDTELRVGLVDYTIAVSKVTYHDGYDPEQISVGLTNYTVTVTQTGANPL